MSGTKAKWRFTALDAAIIIFIALAAAAVIWYLRGGGSGDPVEISYTVEFNGMLESFEGRPQVGDDVYDSVKGYYLGVVTDVYYDDFTTYAWSMEEGTFTKKALPGEINCYVTIKSDGTESGAAVRTSGDNIEVRVGKEMFVKGKGYASPGYIVWMGVEQKGAE